MPWKETCPMDQRMEFVIQHRSGTISMAALFRRPHRSPTRTPKLLAERIVARRKQFPSLGARKGRQTGHK